jgi:hypothetical protein
MSSEYYEAWSEATGEALDLDRVCQLDVTRHIKLLEDLRVLDRGRGKKQLRERGG